MIVAALAAGTLAYFARDHGDTPFDRAFADVSADTGVPANLLRAITRVESSFNPNAKGPTDDHGLMQLTGYAFSHLKVPREKWYDPLTNIRAGAAWLLILRRELERKNRFNMWTWAMAYNTGSDLQPRHLAEAYGGRVVWHWLLYDIGRLGRA